MSYEQLKELTPEECKRFTGVQRATFEQRVATRSAHERDKKKRGRPAKLAVAAQVLVALQYWREYRPYFHIAVSWQLSEAAVGRIVHKVLPGKKKLRERGTQFEGLVIEAPESPIERPQKSSAGTIAARSAAILRKPSSWSTGRVGRFSARP
jgi:hypothetical protein